MLASPLPPSFLDAYSLSTSSLECNCSLVHLSKFISSPLQKESRISNEGYSSGIYSFDKISGRESFVSCNF